MLLGLNAGIEDFVNVVLDVRPVYYQNLNAVYLCHPEAIDREFAKRMKSQLQGARKLVQKDGDRILVKHKYGTTVMPKNPQRIVVLRLEDLTEALGVPVVGANYTPRTYLYDRLEQRGVPMLHVNDETKTVNYEEVQEAKPDLILLRYSFDQGVY